MLRFLGQRIETVEEKLRSRVRLVQADMCEFELDETFVVIILADYAFGYLLTQAD